MSNDPSIADVRAFLAAKFSETAGFISIWEKAGRKTTTFATSELERAADKIIGAARHTDVYVCNATLRFKPAPGKRGSETDVYHLPGFFIDFDFANEKSSEQTYPVDSAELLHIAEQLGLKPTIRISTGRGEHWHFEAAEPWIIETEADRKEAKRTFKRFFSVISKHFSMHGRKVDAVYDLVRNVRIPGTLNHNCTPPRLVRMLENHPDRRYSRKQIEHFLDEHQPEKIQEDKQGDQPRRRANHDAILEGCPWYRQVVVAGAATCSEPDWFAGASIAACCDDGEAAFHAYSAQHPGYSEREAADKFKRAVEAKAPRTCESVANDLGHADLCLACPHFQRIKSPVQLGRLTYDPGTLGPIPLGYTPEGSFCLLDQRKKVPLVFSPTQLASPQILIGLAPIGFWHEQFPPRSKGQLFDVFGAAAGLIEACHRSGPFDPRRVRGRGVWREKDRIIVNFGGNIPAAATERYICFEPLPVAKVDNFPTDRLLELLRRFVWRNPADAVLLLGWFAIAPICGVLQWRPHCFIYGPPNCGKSTLHVIASSLLTPVAVSADGQSTEAGIRQMIKADSRPVIIDEFESDSARSHISSVIKLARSASSAESPVLRGTPEGKAMQFALQTCFLFCAVNPSGLSPADATRILMLEMLAHENDAEVARRIAEDETFFADRGADWCGYMAGLAHLIPMSVDAFVRAMPGIDSRHRKNMAALFAGAFVASHRAIPSDDEAQAWVKTHKSAIDVHSEPFDRDDSAECLDHLLSHIVERNTVGYWLAAARELSLGSLPDRFQEDAERIPRNLDIIVRSKNLEPGFFIRNGSPAIETIFRDTKWARGAWEKSLRKLKVAFSPKAPLHFSSIRTNARAIGLPLDLLPEIDFPEALNEGKY